MKINRTSTKLLLAFALLSSTAAHAQQAKDAKDTAAASKVNSAAPLKITEASTPVELARAAYTAQGGEKFRDLQRVLLPIGVVGFSRPRLMVRGIGRSSGQRAANSS